jgi:uncharacterized protein
MQVQHLTCHNPFNELGDNFMRLHFEGEAPPTRIASYGEGFVVINETRYERSVILYPDRVEPHWPPQDIANLAVPDIKILLETRPEVVLLGTGIRQVFPSNDVLRIGYELGIGVEVMNTMAACRTFNVLAAENRHVVAGLILEQAS